MKINHTGAYEELCRNYFNDSSSFTNSKKMIEQHRIIFGKDMPENVEEDGIELSLFTTQQALYQVSVFMDSQKKHLLENVLTTSNGKQIRFDMSKPKALLIYYLTRFWPYDISSQDETVFSNYLAICLFDGNTDKSSTAAKAFRRITNFPSRTERILARANKVRS